MPEKSGKPKKPPPRNDGPLRIELPFEEAVRAALDTPPEAKKEQKRRRSS
jgi:hypothetical protein